MARALRANPLTAPYAINATWRDGAVVLSGRVGTKQVHDAAVQMAIAFGLRFRDDLVIDTAETLRVAMSATPSMTGYAALAPNLSASYYVYPQPLFGWLDDPFFGMQPPVVSFAPWWRARRDGPTVGPNGGGPMPPAAATNPGGPPANMGPSAGMPATSPWTPPGQAAGQPGARARRGHGTAAGQGGHRDHGRRQRTGLPPRRRGQRGGRPRDRADRLERAGREPGRHPAPGQAAARRRRPEPGAASSAAARLCAAGPPDGPTPAGSGRRRPPPGGAPAGPRGGDGEDPGAAAAGRRPSGSAQPRPAPTAVAALDGQRLTRRVIDALRRRPTLAAQPIQVRTTGDAILLSGKVPSAYEAMLAFRTAQQTPGVRDVVDRLEFLVPDEDHPNPLVSKGRPQDIEPYLIAQMSRHLGELAHIDSVRSRGNHLEIHGTLLEAADKDRVLAILRSIPVLHGFELDTDPDHGLGPLSRTDRGDLNSWPRRRGHATHRYCTRCQGFLPAQPSVPEGSSLAQNGQDLRAPARPEVVELTQDLAVV